MITQTLGYRAVYDDGEAVMFNGPSDARDAWLHDHRVLQIVRVVEESHQGIVFHTRAKGVTDDADCSNLLCDRRRDGVAGVIH